MIDPQAIHVEEDASSSRERPAAKLGLLLRKAREARGLSIDDVVQTLKFSKRQVEALEASDLASLPGNVFVRGFIRSYARYLKIDPEPLLELLADEVPLVQPDVRPPENMGRAGPTRGIRRIPPLVGISVVLLLVAAGMIAWHLAGPQTRTTVPSVSGNGASPVEERPVVPGPQVAGVPAREDAGPTVTASQADAPADQKTVVLAFRGKCWVEVRDASRQVILTGQFEEGAQQSVSGTPPFQLVLGSAAHVDLIYEGRPVDLKPHTRAEVARLTLE